MQDTRWRSLTHLQRCILCILQSQSARLGSLVYLQRFSQCILQPKPTRLHKAGKQLKYLMCKRRRRSWSQNSNQMVQEILFGLQEPLSLIRQGQVDLKPWIPRPCHSQIWWVTLREYQASLTSHSLVWFVTIMTLTKLCHTYYQNIAKLFFT